MGTSINKVKFGQRVRFLDDRARIKVLFQVRKIHRNTREISLREGVPVQVPTQSARTSKLSEAMPSIVVRGAKKDFL